MEQEVKEAKKGVRGEYVLLGAAVGAALGVLFAPKPGKDSRKQLNTWIKNRKGKLPQLLSKLQDQYPIKKEQLAAALKAGRKAYLENAKEHHSNGRIA